MEARRKNLGKLHSIIKKAGGETEFINFHISPGDIEKIPTKRRYGGDQIIIDRLRALLSGKFDMAFLGFKWYRNDLERLLRAYSNKSVTLLLNRGNRGDGLIHAGGRRLFKRYNVSFQEIGWSRPVSGKTLFVFGCGAFCKTYHHMVQLVTYFFDKFEEIIILPSSFDVSCEEVSRFIRELPENVTVFCREKYSYDQVAELIPKKENLFLSPDPAFYVSYFRWKRKGEGVLFAFRSDEKFPTTKVNETNNRDIAIEYNGYREFKKGESRASDWGYLLDTLSGYEEVHTNRIHVAIAAAMLGKKTFIYPMSYHKAKGIYEYSLSHMKNVTWVEKDE